MYLWHKYRWQFCSCSTQYGFPKKNIHLCAGQESFTFSSLSSFIKREHSSVKLDLFANNIYDRRYGFRPMMSTIDAILDFTADVLPSLDKREQCIAVYLDLSKAFDTINNGILLKKLE